MRVISKLELNDFLRNQLLVDEFLCSPARASHRLLIPPESCFHVGLQRYFNLTSPISNAYTDSQLGLLQLSEFHYPLEFSPHANLQSWIIEKPSADSQTQVMVCDEWPWRRTWFAAPHHFGHQLCECYFPRH